MGLGLNIFISNQFIQFNTILIIHILGFELKQELIKSFSLNGVCVNTRNALLQTPMLVSSKRQMLDKINNPSVETSSHL